MKKLFLSILILGAIFSSHNLYADQAKTFSSKKALMKQLHSVGFDHIYKIPYHNRIKILVLNEEGEMRSQQITSYGDIIDVPRVPELDYVNSKKMLVKAYKVGETMLCYQPTYFSMMLGKVSGRIGFKTCYMFPSKISNIVDALVR